MILGVRILDQEDKVRPWHQYFIIIFLVKQGLKGQLLILEAFQISVSWRTK